MCRLESLLINYHRQSYNDITYAVITHKTSRSILLKCASSWLATSHTHPEQPTKNQHAESAPKKERWGQRYGNKFSLQWIWSHTKAGDFQGYVDKSTSDKTPTQSPKRAWNHAPVCIFIGIIRFVRTDFLASFSEKTDVREAQPQLQRNPDLLGNI